MGDSGTDCDVLVIGGGPAGATAALLLARAGRRVVVLEKAVFPRLHVGESILPQNFPLVQELGLEDRLKQLPHVPKYGAEFVMGDDAGSAIRFTFDQGLIRGSPTFNVERSLFDQMLLTAAEEAGAVVRQGCGVDEIERLRDGDVAVCSGGQRLSARYLLDASGHGTVVGRHLGIRREMADEDLKKVAYFGHFERVERLPGRAEGHISIVMCKQGWFWMIALNETKTSVGFVTRPELARTVQVPATRMLQWAIARCPVVRQRMRHAVGAETNLVVADFSYRCQPAAGAGYFLLGDAAAFLDPIFSTGVTLAMKSAQQAATLVDQVLENRLSPAAARRRYRRFLGGSTAVFWRLIRGYYRHSFRELFLNGVGPVQIHRAVISVLAGHVFPRPPWALRWRLHLFHLCVWINRFVPLVPRRREFSLLDEKAAEEMTPQRAVMGS